MVGKFNDNAITVQSVLIKAYLTQKPTTTMGAGRTDTGVHAAQMVASF